jgi:hypothetical protein
MGRLFSVVRVEQSGVQRICRAGLKKVSQATDANEVIEVRWFTPEEVRGMIERNEIMEGMTLTALLWLFLKCPCP